MGRWMWQAVAAAALRAGALLRRPLAADVGVMATAQLAGMALGLATTIVSARLMGPEAYGVAALLIAFPSLLWSFVGVKSMAITTRYIATLRAEGDGARLAAICKLGFALDLAASVTTFALVATTAGWVTPHVLGLPGGAWASIAYAASLPFYSLSGTSGAIFSSWGRFGTIGAFQTAERVLTLGSVVAALSAGTGVTGYIVVRAATQAVVGIAMAVVAGRLVVREHGRRCLAAPVASLGAIRGELAGLFGWNYVAVTFSGILSQLPLLILGRVRGPVEAGYFRLGSNLISAGSSLENALARVTYPVLSQRWGTGERVALRATLRRWSIEAGVPLGTIAAAGIPALPVLVSLVLGSGYADMVLGTQVMMAGAVVSLVFFYVNVFYYAAGRVALWTKAFTVYTLATVALAWPCAVASGFLGVAVLVAGGEIAFTVTMLLLIEARIPFAAGAVSRA